MAKQSKKDAILSALLRGESLTPLSALQQYRCFSLAQRISEFRAEGLPIKDEFVDGEPFKRYWIELEPAEVIV